MLYTSTAIECSKLRESGRDLSLKTGFQHSISMLSLKRLCHKFACTCSIIRLFRNHCLPVSMLWKLQMSIVLRKEHNIVGLGLSAACRTYEMCKVSSVQNQYTNFCVRKRVGVRRCLFGGLSDIQPNEYEGGNCKRTPTMCIDITMLKSLCRVIKARVLSTIRRCPRNDRHESLDPRSPQSSGLEHSEKRLRPYKKNTSNSTSDR